MIAEKLLSNLKSQAADAERKFHALAASLAANENVDDQEALNILHAANKTPDDLEKETRRLCRIGEVRPLIAELQQRLSTFNSEYQNNHMARMEKLKQVRDAAEAELNAADREYQGRMSQRQVDGIELSGLETELRSLENPQPVNASAPNFVAEQNIGLNY